jgi:hypothetical protein
VIAASTLLTASALFLGCSCDTPVETDAGMLDAPLPMGADAAVDAFVPPGVDAGRDAFSVDAPRADTNSDGGMVVPMGPRITICPGDALPPIPDAACRATAGDNGTLITADILTPGEVFRGGQVLVDATGSITCVGCDCTASAGASTATTVECPDAVLSPGLINAHEHLTFLGQPYTRTTERYEHRHDWRRGIRSHTRIPPRMAVGTEIPYAELRMVMGGATSVNGSTGGASMANQRGFLRNIDVSASQEGLGQPQVDYDTFPLGDNGGTLRSSGCDYGTGGTRPADIATRDSYTPHISEGIDVESRNEFLCLSASDRDLIQPQTAMIHGVSLLPTDIQQVATDGTMLIWSPRTNVTLYGETARVPEYDRLGVQIAMGTDWVFTGSMNMLRELQCADELNANYFENHFTDEELWLMATYNGAVAAAMDEAIGSIAVGRVADLALFDARVNVDHRAVIDANPQDVLLVMRSGRAMYGQDAIVSALPDGTMCETLEVCSTMKRVCAMREIGIPLAMLQANNVASYPLFACGTPMNEPSCIPERNGTAASVNASTRYTGLSTATDVDGDGIENAMDNCPGSFNPIRPLDNGMQADGDMDGEGDVCDVCPLNADTTMCSAPDPNDRDGDGVLNTTDNCPDLSNPTQADADSDMKGDACDACPMVANPGSAACPATIYTVKRGATTGMTSLSGVVTAVATNGFFMQTMTTDPMYAGPDFSGIFVFTMTAPGRAIGDEVNVSGRVTDFFGQTQLTSMTVTVIGTGRTLPPVVDVTPAEVQTGGARATALEGVLVRIMTTTCTNPAPAPAGGETGMTFEYEVGGGLRVDDLFFRTAPFPTMSETFSSITGVLAWRRSNSKLHPRSATDIVRP